MGLALERKNLLSCRSERVKAVDFHPTEPWVLSALYNGTVTIRNFQTNSLVKTIEVCDLPVRTAKFIARKNWIVCGSDDLVIRVFNYNTLEKVTQFTAHSDYIRSLAIHPTRPFLLSASDDLSIKLWDWERAWKQVATFEGHSHYVMAIAFNPKDSNVFASVSLDKTIKMWSFTTISAGVSSSTASAPPVCVKANYTLSDGHEKGINCIDFYGGADRPFLVTGSDDFTVRVWDYQTKSCVRVLEGHGNNVSSVAFHPQLPLLLTASEDGGMRIWNALTFRPEASYSFGMERAWSLATSRAFNAVAVGFDAGTLVMQLGRGDPAASLDPVQGRLVWSRSRNGVHGNEILTALVRLVDVEGKSVRSPADGELIPLSPKELGTSDVFPQFLQHSPDGRMVAVCGDGEFVLYSTIGWRNRSFGRGQEVVWSNSSDLYAVRESASRIVINKLSSGSEANVLNVSGADRIFGNGPLLGVSLGGSTLCFYDWSGSCLIRVIDVAALAVNWSPCGRFVAILSDDACFVLSVNQDILASPQSFPAGEDGIEDSMDLVDELDFSLKSLSWIKGNDCFVYLTMENKLAYHVVGGGADEAFQIALFDRPTFLLGYLAAEERVYVCDQDLQVSSYAICGPLIAFQTAVLQCSQAALPAEIANLISSIPASLHAKLAIFLNRRGFVKEALKLSPDADFKFSLALQLGELKVAQSILAAPAYQLNSAAWSELGRAALKAWNLPVAEEAFLRASDLPALFLLYAAGGDAAGLQRVAQKAAAAGQVNLAFSAFFKAGDLEAAFSLLLKEGRAAEAAVFARTYGLPAERIGVAVADWRGQLKARRGKAKLAEAISDPVNNAELFEVLKQSSSGRTRSVSFDGNVSVVGGSGQVFQMKPAEAVTEVFASSLASSVVTDVFSDDQMSLEVNTAGTGTRLEDLEECELSEEQATEEADLDNLREPAEASMLSQQAYEAEELAEAIEEIAIEEPFEPEISHDFVPEQVEPVYVEPEAQEPTYVEQEPAFESTSAGEEPVFESTSAGEEPVFESAYVEQAEPVFEPTYVEQEPAFESAYTEQEELEQEEPVFESTYVEQEIHEPAAEPETHEQEAQDSIAEEVAYEPVEVDVHEPIPEAVYLEEDYPEIEEPIWNGGHEEHAVEPTEHLNYQEEKNGHVETSEPFAYEETTEPFAYEETTEPFTYEETTEPFAYEETTEPFAYEETTEPFTYEETTEPFAYEETTEPFAYEETTEPFAYEEPANKKSEPAKAEAEEVHEEIDFGGDGEADGWL